MPKITRMQGLMAAGLGLALFACGDEPVASDLNTEGAPRVIAVTVLDEIAWNNFNYYYIYDIATYCADPAVEKTNANYCPKVDEQLLAQGDECYFPPAAGEFRCGTDTVCRPESEEDDGRAKGTCVQVGALPLGWQARVVFNELLNSSVENLLPCVDVNHDGVCSAADDDDDGLNHGSLIATQPVTLTCGGQAIAYDGYYQPTGNHLSVPPGPSLVIQPLELAATGSTCEITVKSNVVQDKDQEAIADSGSFSFRIAPMTIESASIANDTEIGPDSSVAVFFNTLVDESSLAGNVTVTDTTNGGVQHPVVAVTDPEDNKTVVVSSASGAWDPGTDYTLTIDSGVQDIKGGSFSVDQPFTLNFTTTQ
jgi:hypothetical protein